MPQFEDFTKPQAAGKIKGNLLSIADLSESINALNKTKKSKNSAKINKAVVEKNDKNNSLLINDVVNPFVNSAFINGYDSIVHLVNKASQDIAHKKVLSQIDPLKTGNAKQYSAGWFLNEASSGLGSLVPYVIAGKLTNLGLCKIGESADLTGFMAKTMANEKVGQIVGAGLYSSILTPGHDQTRLSNALATMASFSVFEAGNSFKATSGVLGRFATGLAGGATQIELSHHLAVGGWAKPSDVINQSISSGAFNVFLPIVQEGASRVIDLTSNKFGDGIKVSRFAKVNDLSGQSPTLDNLIDDNPFAKAKIVEKSLNTVDIGKKAITLNSPDGSVLGHELAHLSSYHDPNIKAGFERAQDLINHGQEDEAQSAYTKARLTGESIANQAENQIASELGLNSPQKPIDLNEIAKLRPLVNRTYIDHYNNEFNNFKFNGKDAKLDFHGDGPSKAGSQAIDKATVLNYPNGTETKFGTATQIQFFPDGSKTYAIAQEPSGQIYKFVQEAPPNGSIETAYGKASTITHLENIKEYNIINGSNGVADGSNIVVYLDPIQSPYGQVNYVENQTNGNVVFENSLDGSHGIIYKTPQDFGSFKNVVGIRQFNDGSDLYWMNDAAQSPSIVRSVTKVPDFAADKALLGAQKQITLDKQVQSQPPVDTSLNSGPEISTQGRIYESYPKGTAVNTSIGNFQAILREPGQTTYFKPDGSEFIAKPNGNSLDILDPNGNLLQNVPKIEENYPAISSDAKSKPGINDREFGKVVKVITGPDATNFINDQQIQNIVFRNLQPSDYGKIMSLEIFPNGDKTYFANNGNKVYQLVNPVNTTYGYVERMVEKPNGDMTYLREGGMNLTKRADGLSVVEDFPNGIQTGLSSVNATQVERYLTALVYHFTDGSSASVDYKNNIARIIDKNGTFTIQTIMWSPLAEDYPNGRPTMWGNAQSMIITGTGQATMLFGSYGDAYTNQITVNLLGQPLIGDTGVNFRTPTLPTQVATNNEENQGNK